MNISAMHHGDVVLCFIFPYWPMGAGRSTLVNQSYEKRCPEMIIKTQILR